MTTVTDAALDWYHSKSLDRDDARIDMIAVGSGTDSEGQNATGLTTEEYRAHEDNTNIEFVEQPQPGVMEAVIRVKGGTEVPADTDISELMVVVSGDFVVGDEDQEVVIAVDNFSGITVEAGHTEEFTMPFSITR